MAGETGEVSSIGVKLTLEAGEFMGGMKAAQGSLNTFQEQAARAGSGAGQLKAGGGRQVASGPSSAQNLSGVNVSLSLNKGQLAELRTEISRGLGSIPVSITPQFARSGPQSIQNIMGAMLSMQYGGSPAQGRIAAKQAIERYVPQIPHRASGGAVQQGHPVVVGEHRAEVFRPGASGWIEKDIREYRRRAAELAALEYQIAQSQHRMSGGWVIPHRAQAGPAHKGGLPRGYKIEFYSPEDAAESLHSVPSLDRPGGYYKPIKKPMIKGPRSMAGVVAVVTKGSEVVANFPFSFDPSTEVHGVPTPYGSMHPDYSLTATGHRRKGLATAAYVKTERLTGRPVAPSGVQLVRGKSFWAQPDRPFGKIFGQRPVDQWNREATAREDEYDRLRLEAERNFANAPVSNYIQCPQCGPRAGSFTGQAALDVHDRQQHNPRPAYQSPAAQFPTTGIPSTAGGGYAPEPPPYDAQGRPSFGSSASISQFSRAPIRDRLRARARAFNAPRPGYRPLWGQVERWGGYQPGETHELLSQRAQWAEQRERMSGIPKMSYADIMARLRGRMAGGPVERSFRVADPMGLHMRPSSVLAQVAQRYPEAAIQIRNLTNGAAPETGYNARSMMGWAQLMAIPGDEIGMTGEGPGASLALHQLARLGGSPKLTGVARRRLKRRWDENWAATHAWRGATARAYYQTHLNEGGTFPVDPGARIPWRGHAIEIPKALGLEPQHIDPADPVAFMRAFHASKRAGAPYVGTWLDPDTGKIDIGPSTVVGTQRHADMVLRALGEKAAYDLRKTPKDPWGHTWYASDKRLRAGAGRINELIFGHRQGGGWVVPESTQKHPLRGLNRLPANARDLHANIIAHAETIKPRIIEEGRDWWTIAHAQAMGDLSDPIIGGKVPWKSLGIDPMYGMAAFAAASPGQQWRKNRAAIRHLLESGVPQTAGSVDVPGFGQTTYTAAQGLDPFYNALTYLHGGGEGFSPTAVKTGAMFMNLSGLDPNVLTYDARMQQIITAARKHEGEFSHKFWESPDAGDQIRRFGTKAMEDVFPEYAKRWGLNNISEFQAILWSGLKSNVGKHKGTGLGKDWARTASGIAIPRHPGLEVPFHRAAGGVAVAGQPHGLVHPGGGMLSQILQTAADWANDPFMAIMSYQSLQQQQKKNRQHGGVVKQPPLWVDPSFHREIYPPYQKGIIKRLTELSEGFGIPHSITASDPNDPWMKAGSYGSAGLVAAYAEPFKITFNPEAVTPQGFGMEERASRMGMLFGSKLPSTVGAGDPLATATHEFGHLAMYATGIPAMEWLGKNQHRIARAHPSIYSKEGAQGGFRRWEGPQKRTPFSETFAELFADAYLNQKDPFGIMDMVLSQIRRPEQNMERWIKTRQWLSAGMYNTLPNVAKRAGGGGAGEGLYIVGEIGPELFVPNRLAHLIPKGVMDQIPKRAGGGIVEIGRKRNEIFAPPEDGLIIPNRLIDQIPHAMAGFDFMGNPVPGNQPMGFDRGETPEQTSAGVERLFAAIGQGAQAPQTVQAQTVNVTAQSARLETQNATAAGAAGAAAGRMPPGYQNIHGVAVPPGTDEERIRQIRRYAEPPVSGPPNTPDVIAATVGLQTVDQATATHAENIAKMEREGASASKSMVLNRRNVARDLAEGRAGVGKEMPSRTPQGAIASVASFLFGGVQQMTKAQVVRVQAEQEYMAAHRRTETAIKRSAGTMATFRAEVAKYDVGTQERSDAEADLAGARERARKTLSPLIAKEKERGEDLERATKKTMPTTGGVLRNLGVIIGATTAYGMAMQAASMVIDQAVIPAAGKMVDELTGWTPTFTRVSTAMAENTRQQGGNYKAAVAAASATAGLSLETENWVEQSLKASTTAKAGSKAMTEARDLMAASLGSTNTPDTGIPIDILENSVKAFTLGATDLGFLFDRFRSGPAGSPQGLYGGYGGVGGTSLFAEQLGGGPGFQQQITDFMKVNTKPTPATGAASIAQGVMTAAGSIFGPVGALVANQVSGAILGPLGGTTPGPGTKHMVENMQSAMGRAAGQEGVLAYGIRGTKGGEVEKLDKMGADQTVIDMAKLGYVYTDSAGNLIASLDELDRAVGQVAKGMTIPDMATWFKTVTRAMEGQFQIAQQTQARAIETEIPIETWKSLVQQPLLGAGAGVVGKGGVSAAGFSGQTATWAKGLISDIQTSNQALTDMGKAGFEAARADVQTNNPLALPQFDALAAEANTASAKIQGLNSEIAKLSQEAAQANWANQIRIARRSLGDALGMLGRIGGTRLGQLQREQWLNSRASQQLGLQLQQRQITTQLALAQFQAPGETGEERYFRQKQTIAEAGVAQTQLGFSFKEFTISGQIWKITAERAATDATKAIEVMTVAQNAQLGAALAAQAISNEQRKLGVTMGKIDAILSTAKSNWGTVMQAAGQYVTQFGGSVKDAMKEVWKALGYTVKEDKYGKVSISGTSNAGQVGGPGYSAQPTSPKPAGENWTWNGYGWVKGNASGFLGNFARGAMMTVGEAGPETVAILRNPRAATMGGGGGPSNVTVNINGPVVRNDGDISSLARQVAAEVERTLSRKGQMFGLRGPAV